MMHIMPDGYGYYACQALLEMRAMYALNSVEYTFTKMPILTSASCLNQIYWQSYWAEFFHDFAI